MLGEALRPRAAVPRSRDLRDGGRQAAAPRASDATVDPAILERLRASATSGAQSPKGDRNLANMLSPKAGYAEAERPTRQLIAKQPERRGLHASLAGALGALGRYDEAASEIDARSSARAAQSRGVPQPRRHPGEAGQARRRSLPTSTALRYDPQYAPSREALARLGRSHRGRAATRGSAAWRRARRAGRRTPHAAATTPRPRRRSTRRAARIRGLRARAPVPRQRRVPEGDASAAIAALKRALEIEPDNALFRANLERLEKTGAR